MKHKLKKQLRKIPDKPGVYIFKSSEGQILYVGKAACLKKRINSYFNKTKKQEKVAKLLENTDKLDYILTSNEAEALLVENKLIKKETPRYNVMYRDDKSYPLIEITFHKFPRVYVTRGKENENSIYLGPFTNVKLLKEGLSYLRKIIPFRTCKNLPKKACLDYYIGLCPAPCEGKITPEKYRENVNKVKIYLQGDKKELINKLEKEMKELSNKKKYERAADIRDKIKALTKIAADIDSSGINAVLYKIKQKLNLSNIPVHIEAFDISNISGKQAVGSMVVFKNGKPYKKGYRRFKIKQEGPDKDRTIDDYRMMEEVLRRRYIRILKEEKQLPDLVVIDGGKGHLNIAIRILRKLGIENRIDIISIAKKFDYIFHIEGNKIRPYKLNPEELKILQQVRDESHRFANKYHHILRSKLTTASELDNIPGIGPKRKKALLKYFGNIEEIKKAEEDKLSQVSSMNSLVASKVKDYFK